MYESECWCMRKEDESRIVVAEMSWLRRIAGKTRRARIHNEVIRRELGQTETLIRRMRLTWFGHMVRMEGKRLPAKALYCYVYGKEVEKDKERHGWTT